VSSELKALSCKGLLNRLKQENFSENLSLRIGRNRGTRPAGGFDVGRHHGRSEDPPSFGEVLGKKRLVVAAATTTSTRLPGIR